MDANEVFTNSFLKEDSMIELNVQGIEKENELWLL